MLGHLFTTFLCLHCGTKNCILQERRQKEWDVEYKTGQCRNEGKIMKRKFYVVLAVLCLSLLTVTGCSTNNDTNNSVTSDDNTRDNTTDDTNGMTGNDTGTGNTTDRTTTDDAGNTGDTTGTGNDGMAGDAVDDMGNAVDDAVQDVEDAVR